WLHRRGVPRWLGAVAVYAGLAALVAAVVLCAVPLLAEQIGTLASSAPGQLGRLRQALHGSSNRLLRELGGRVPDLGAMKLLSAPLDLGQAGRLWPLARAAGRGALIIGATLLLAFFWTIEGQRRVRALALLAPLDRRRELAAFAR